MKAQELKTRIENYQKNPDEKGFRIICSLADWNDSSIIWSWGTLADEDMLDYPEYTVRITFQEDNEVYVTLLPEKERLSNSVNSESYWDITPDDGEFFEELIENAEIFALEYEE